MASILEFGDLVIILFACRLSTAPYSQTAKVTAGQRR
jgi:hypothetical protein